MVKLNPLFKYICAISAVLFLAGCGGPQSNERFVASDGVRNGQTYQDQVDAMLSDDKITRAETEQAIVALNQCYEDEGLAGEYAFDLDIHPWIINSRYTLAKTHPDYREPTESESAELTEKIGNAIGKAMTVCDAVFKPVENRVVNEKTLQTTLLDVTTAKYECLANNAPDFAKRLDPELIRQDPIAASERLLDAYTPTEHSELERNAIEQCLYYATARKRTIGGGL